MCCVPRGIDWWKCRRARFALSRCVAQAFQMPFRLRWGRASPGINHISLELVHRRLERLSRAERRPHATVILRSHRGRDTKRDRAHAPADHASPPSYGWCGLSGPPCDAHVFSRRRPDFARRLMRIALGKLERCGARSLRRPGQLRKKAATLSQRDTGFSGASADLKPALGRDLQVADTAPCAVACTASRTSSVITCAPRARPDVYLRCGLCARFWFHYNKKSDRRGAQLLAARGESAVRDRSFATVAWHFPLDALRL
jgi:hypothetical protein